jgi:peptide/nickel transport system permease protein
MAGSIHVSASTELGDPDVPTRRRGSFRALLRSPAGIIGLALTGFVLAVALLADFLAPYSPMVISGPALLPPSEAHPMGTDDLGRDVYSRVLHGARTSLSVALVVGLMAFSIGTLVGAVSGFRGGPIGEALMRITELFQVMPRFFLAIVVLALFGTGLDRLILALGLTSWAMLARVVRAEVLSIRERDFVEAARALGTSDRRILFRHVMPNVLPVTVIYVALIMGSVMLLEASLGFLGFGDPNAVSWGTLAGQAQRFLRVAWWLSVFPGLALVIAVLGFNLLADGLTDARRRR